MNQYTIILLLLVSCSMADPNKPVTVQAPEVPPDSVLISQGWERKDSCPFFSKSLSTGYAPKSCTFSPDGNYLYVTLLNHPTLAVQIFSVDPFEKIRTLKPGGTERKNDLNYPEGRFYEKDSTFWFTRMTTGEYFVYHFDTDSLEEGRSTNGTWTKVVEFSPDARLVAFSHWISNSISIFEAETHKHIRDINTNKTPRGIAWIGNDTIAVASFDEFDIQVFEVNTGELLHSMHEDNAAMRDVHYDSTRKMLYYDDMRYAIAYKYDWANRQLMAETKVFSHPNTMKLSHDGRFLYVSCRGPNNPDGYIYPSKVNGKIQIINTDNFEIIAEWEQGNQPTGLDISPDGKYLAATDFSTHRLNLYLIRQLPDTR